MRTRERTRPRPAVLAAVLLALPACSAEDTQLDRGQPPSPQSLSRDHVEGPVAYPDLPPIGGDHNPVWQSCQGDVYTERIASEYAVHSLEHGAVWITYSPNLPDEEVQQLATRVRGLDYMMMSPLPGLGSPIALSAWGSSLAVSRADDPQIDEFIRDHRISASQEPGATCSSPVRSQGLAEPLTPDELRRNIGE